MEFTGERYVPSETGAIRQEHMHRYAWCAGFVAGKEVLDVASGEGYGSAMLAATARSVVGVDVSEAAVEHARASYGAIANLSFVAGSAAQLPLADRSVDVVVSFETIEHLGQQQEMLAEIRRVLRPDGLLVISSPNRRVYSDQAGYHNEYHVKELYFTEFDELLREQFPVVRYLGHRLSVGSTIAPLPGGGSEATYLAFTDTGSEVEPRVAIFEEPIYFIGIATSSESLLPKVSSSVLYSEAEDLYEHHREVARWAQRQDAEIARVSEAFRLERSRADEMRQWAQELDARIKGLDLRHEELQAAHAESSEWARQLREQLARSTELERQLRGELAESQDDLGRHRALVLQLDRRLLAAEAHAEDLDGRLKDAGAQMQEMACDVENMGAKAAELRSELAERVAAYEVRIGQIEAAATTRNAELMSEIGALQRQLQGIVHSRSWRLTRPLRFLGRVVHGDWAAVVESLRGAPWVHRAWLKPFHSPVKRWLMRRVQPAVVLQQSTFVAAHTGSDDLHGLSFPACDMPAVSVIVPAYGNLPYTLACLRSIAANPPQVTYEVLVVEDASGDEEILKLRDVPGLRFHENAENLGFLRSCNGSAALARGDFLCFLNNDTEVTPGWLDALVEVFSKMPDAGMAGARLVYPDGRQQEAGGIVWSDGSAWNFGRLQDPRQPEFNYIKEADYVSGAAILLRSALFRELGGFDEHYVPAYCEDTDLAFRVRQAGFKVYYQPNANVIHHEGISHGTDTSQGIKAYQVQNQEKLRKRWQATLTTEHFENAECVFLAKDRSQLKKTILVIDHYVPQPDRDAGSRTMWQFMRLFRKHGMSVKFWPENLWFDPHYAPLLQQEGVEVIYGPGYVGRFEDWIRENGRAIDYVLTSRPYVSIGFLNAIKKHSPATVLYYGHDVHHLRVREQLKLEHKRELELQLIELEGQEREVWGQVDVIYYPSDIETSYVNDSLRQGGHTERCRTIPVYAFDSFPPEPWANAAARMDLLFVAGFAHPPNSDAAVWLVREVLPLIRRRYPSVKLSLVGSNPTEAVRNLEGDGVHVTGFVSDEALSGYYGTAKVAVAPLRYGGGMKGKVVEAMRFGIPCVTTPAGAQGFSGTDDFLAVAEDPESFASEVMRLLEDEAAWQRASRLSQAFAQARFSEEALWNVVSEHIDARPYASVAARRTVLQ